MFVRGVLEGRGCRFWMRWMRLGFCACYAAGGGGGGWGVQYTNGGADEGAMDIYEEPLYLTTRYYNPQWDQHFAQYQRTTIPLNYITKDSESRRWIEAVFNPATPTTYHISCWWCNWFYDLFLLPLRLKSQFGKPEGVIFTGNNAKIFRRTVWC